MSRARKGEGPVFFAAIDHHARMTCSAVGTTFTFVRRCLLMVRALSHLEFCREAFGRRIGLTGSSVRDSGRHCAVAGGRRVSPSAIWPSMRSPRGDSISPPEVGRLESQRTADQARGTKQDRRSVLVRLSAEGEKMFKELTPYMRDVNDILFNKLTSGMNRLHAILSSFPITATAPPIIKRKGKY